MSDILKTGKILSETQQGLTILLPKARASYTNLINGDDFYSPPKQCITLIFDEAEVDLNAVITPALLKYAKANKIKCGQVDEGLHLGQGVSGDYLVFKPSATNSEGEYWAGHSETTKTMVLKTNVRREVDGSPIPVTCFDARKRRLSAEEIASEIYDGCYVRAIMVAKVQKNKKTGKVIPMVCLYLNQIQKIADGERFGEATGDGFDDLPPEDPTPGDLSQFE